mgnify:CR=1 FL=1
MPHFNTSDHLQVSLTAGTFITGNCIAKISHSIGSKITIQIYIGEKKQEHKLASIRPNGDLFLISIEGFTDCDAVSVFRNQWVYAQSSTVGPLPDGLFYHREVIGMKVIDEQGNLLGVVKEILVTGANDVYVVDTQDNHEILLPAIKSVILSMNRDTRSMVVRLQEWD